ncbi:MAG TPA: hypothetical protein VGS28_00890 [Candidatus Saccharimonadales bacterium]|nr:hypothetical protein [Candidatus Saccharimonadales bacterium]
MTSYYVPVELNLTEQAEFDRLTGEQEKGLVHRTVLSSCEIALANRAVLEAVARIDRRLEDQGPVMREVALPLLGSMARTRAQLILAHGIEGQLCQWVNRIHRYPRHVAYDLADALASLAYYLTPALRDASSMPDILRTESVTHTVIPLSRAIESLAAQSGLDPTPLHQEHLREVLEAYRQPPIADPYSRA